MKREKDLKQLFEEYLNYCNYPQKLSKETIRGYKESFRNFSVLMPKITKPSMLTVEVMEKFFQCLGTRKRKVSKNIEKVGVKASTIGTYWSKLHTYFEWLCIRGYMQTNPLNPKTGVKPPRVEYNDKKALTKTEIHKLISAVMLQYKNLLLCKRDVAMIHLLYFCGLRRGELIGLRVFDIDMDRLLLKVNGETSKSGKDRILPMNRQLAMRLQDYLDERSKLRHKYKTEKLLVATNGDHGLTTHGLKHWVQRLRTLSGVRFHLHQLRHSYACALASTGTGVLSLQRLMGHTDPRMTQRYLRSLSAEDLRGEVDRLTIDNLV